MKWVRRLYDWVLHWAQTPYGLIALFVCSFVEASFFPIPPDPLLIALILGLRKKAFRFATYCIIASTLGGIFGYAIGHFIWWSSSNEFSSVAWFFFNNIPGFSPNVFADMKVLYEEWNFWIIFAAGFTPIPFKVFTISAGAFEINFILFTIAALLGRTARFMLVAWLIWKFGEQIKAFIDKYFNWLAIAFTVLLIGGFLVIKYLL